jgi:hypothetical protein
MLTGFHFDKRIFRNPCEQNLADPDRSTHHRNQFLHFCGSWAALDLAEAEAIAVLPF